MNPRGLRDLDPLGNHKHPCASRVGVYIGFRGHLNPVDLSVSSYNLYLTSGYVAFLASVQQGKALKMHVLNSPITQYHAYLPEIYQKTKPWLGTPATHNGKVSYDGVVIEGFH